MDPSSLAVEDIVDLERYPIHDLRSPFGEALVARCRVDLAAVGACNLLGFLRADAVSALAAEATGLEAVAYYKSARRNAYFTPDDPTLAPNDPRRMFFHTQIGQVADDQIPTSASIKRLYRWDALTEFLRRALGLDALYRMADPFQALNLTYLRPRDHQAWHFDDGDFVITLLLQEPEAGGDFEFVPHVRCDTDERLGEVGNALSGTHPRLCRLERTPGTLTLFQGKHSVHRVTEVRGTITRISAIFSYDRRPDCVAEPDVNIFTYGPRVARILAQSVSQPNL